MRTFKAYFKKEILESSRQYRYIILAVGIIFFAVATPIMLKLLPKLLQNQMGADLSSLFVITRRAGYANYIGDLIEIGILVTAFTLSGILSEEITMKKLVFPYSKGGSPIQIVAAKFLHYSLTMSVLIILGFIVNYYYVNILIVGDDVLFGKVMMSALLVCLYYINTIALIMLFSCLFKRGFIAGIVTVMFSFLSISLANIDVLGRFLPYNLISKAAAFNAAGVLPTVILTLIYTAAALALASYRMNRVEVV